MMPDPYIIDSLGSSLLFLGICVVALGYGLCALVGWLIWGNRK